MPIAALRNPEERLLPVLGARAQLRKAKNVERDRLAPAIHAGIRIAEAVLRVLKEPNRRVDMPPPDPAAWWHDLKAKYRKVDLRAITTDLWDRGVPVVPLDELPAPKFQGMACLVSGRPVVVIGHDIDAPPRLGFLVAHETGHLANGDCGADNPVIDESDEVSDQDAIEVRADNFAWNTLYAGADAPAFNPSASWKEIAQQANDFERRTQVDAGVLVWQWAGRSGRFADAQMALRSLYLAQGGKRFLKQIFASHIDLNKASETDRSLLSCMAGGPRVDAPAPR